MCKFELNIPNRKTKLCGAYSKSKRNDGKYWAHYPVCDNNNCPLKYEELLCNSKLS
jgi:hypothetical protein